MALLKAAATVGGYTLLSRVLGFARDVLTAALLGAGPVADAFFVAQRLPNLFRSLFAEGAFSAAFVPLFAGRIAQDGEENAKRFAEDALSVLLAALIIFTILGEIFTPEILSVIAPGFASDPEKFGLTVDLTRITFPYLLYISLATLLGGMLNSVERFAATAATPTLLNIALIIALVTTRPPSGYALAWATSAAGLAQFLWLMVSCHRAGIAPRLPWPRLTPEVRRLVRVMAPGVVGAGATQLNLLVSTAVASLLPAGAVSYLYYADRLNQLPLAVVGIAVGTAILPSLSRQVRQGDTEAAIETQNRGLELALLLTLPAAVALGITAHAILFALFQRGAFGPEEVAATAPALAAYAAGLPAFVLVKVMTPGFFARQDTGTPVKIAVVSMASNILLTLALMLPLAHVGNALANSAAGWINALALIVILHRRGHFRLDARCQRALPRIVLASLGMGAVLLFLEGVLIPGEQAGLLLRALGLAALVASGIVTFAGLALLFGATDVRGLKQLLKRRRPAP